MNYKVACTVSFKHNNSTFPFHCDILNEHDMYMYSLFNYGKYRMHLPNK